MRTGHAIESYPALISLSTNAVTWVWIGVLVAALLVFPNVVSGHTLVLGSTVLIAAVGAVGLNLLTGSTGLISLGQSGFLAIGGYTCALSITRLHLPPEVALIFSGVVSGALSLLIGVPSLRLKGLYLAITTLAFSFIVTHVILYAEPVTQGPLGVRIPDVKVLGLSIAEPRQLYYLALLTAVLVVLFALNLMRSRTGRAWIAIRDHDIAAKTMGINLVTYKLLAFVVSSFVVGLAGGLMALQLRFITPDVFGMFLSIEALAMILVGGIGSVAGAILGALFIVMLPDTARLVLDLFGTQVLSSSTQIFEIRGVLTGLIIVAMLRIEPDGLIGIWRDVKRFWTQWPLSL